MITEQTIKFLEKLTYIDKVEKTENFYILLHYNGNMVKQISRRAGVPKVKKLLDKIKQEIDTKNEDHSKTMSFYVA